MTSLVFTRQARSQSEMPSNVTRCKRCIAYPGDCSLSGRQCPLAWRCALENDQPAPEQAAHDGSGRHDVSHQGSILNSLSLRAVIEILRPRHSVERQRQHGWYAAQQALCNCSNRLTCTSGCNTHITGKLPSIWKLVLMTKTNLGKEHLLLTEAPYGGSLRRSWQKKCLARTGSFVHRKHDDLYLTSYAQTWN